MDAQEAVLKRVSVLADGKIIGLFGMYETVDAESGGKLFVQKMKEH